MADYSGPTERETVTIHLAEYTALRAEILARQQNSLLVIGAELTLLGATAALIQKVPEAMPVLAVASGLLWLYWMDLDLGIHKVASYIMLVLGPTLSANGRQALFWDGFWQWLDYEPDKRPTWITPAASHKLISSIKLERVQGEIRIAPPICVLFAGVQAVLCLIYTCYVLRYFVKGFLPAFLAILNYHSFAEPHQNPSGFSALFLFALQILLLLLSLSSLGYSVWRYFRYKTMSASLMSAIQRGRLLESPPTS